jgi:transcriptional regulator with XRE-family HTH domain
MTTHVATCLPLYFGRVIKQLRQYNRFSQEELAQRAQLNRTYLGEVERGVAIPSLTTIAKIAVAFDVSAAELISQSETWLQREFRKNEELLVNT